MSHVSVCLLGNSSVGKSSVLAQYVNRRFDLNTKTTIGTDLATKTISLGAEGVVTLQLRDTAGQERYRSLASSHYRGSEVLVVVFSLVDADSFDSVEEWVQDFRRTVHIEEGERFPIFVVGNKSDLEEERQIQKADAARWCAQHGFQYLETSAKLADGVDHLFRECATAAVHRRKQKAFLDEGTVQSAPQRARLVPVGKSSAVQEEEKRTCGGTCGSN